MAFSFKKLETVDLISKYRSHLMGIAILLVVFYHSNIVFGTDFLSHLFYSFKEKSYLGVDMFFFLSGFGLIVGWMGKKQNFLNFYKRRFLRIMPIYWFFTILEVLISFLTGSFLSTMTIITFFLGIGYFFIGRGHWFISAILICYIFFPFFAVNFLRSRNKFRFLAYILGLCLAVSVIVTMSEWVFGNRFVAVLIFLLRLPAFFIGTFLGYVYAMKDKSFNCLFSIPFNLVVVFLSFVLSFLMRRLLIENPALLHGLDWNSFILWYPFIFVSFSIIFLISVFIHLLSEMKHFLFVLFFLNIVGNSTLELFLVHPLIFNNFKYILTNNYLWLLAILCSVVLALIANYFFSKLIDFLSKLFNL